MSLFPNITNSMGLLSNLQDRTGQQITQNNQIQANNINQLVARLAAENQAKQQMALQERLIKQQQMASIGNNLARFGEVFAKTGLERERLNQDKAKQTSDEQFRKDQLEQQKTLAERGFGIDEKKLAAQQEENSLRRQDQRDQFQKEMDLQRDRLRIQADHMAKGEANDAARLKLQERGQLLEYANQMMLKDERLSGRQLEIIKAIGTGDLDLSDPATIKIIEKNLGSDFLPAMIDNTGIGPQPNASNLDVLQGIADNTRNPEKKARLLSNIEALKQDQERIDLAKEKPANLSPEQKRAEAVKSQDLEDILKYPTLNTSEQEKQIVPFLQAAERLGPEVPSNLRNKVMSAKQWLTSKTMNDVKNLDTSEPDTYFNALSDAANAMKLVASDPKQLAPYLESFQQKALQDYNLTGGMSGELTPPKKDILDKINQWRNSTGLFEGYLVPDWQPHVGLQPVFGKSYGIYKNIGLGTEQDYNKFQELYSGVK